MSGALHRTAILRHSWKNCLHNNYLSIIWDSIVAIFQQLQAVFITPIMKYPLKHHPIIVSFVLNWFKFFFFFSFAAKHFYCKSIFVNNLNKKKKMYAVLIKRDHHNSIVINWCGYLAYTFLMGRQWRRRRYAITWHSLDLFLIENYCQ